jgi:hypothetical protein
MLIGIRANSARRREDNGSQEESMNLTREEANRLRILSEGGGSLVVAEGDEAWDRLVAGSFVTAAATGNDSVRYDLTDAGRAALRRV